MPKRLTGSAGTGKKILQNTDLYNYTYNGAEQVGNNTLHKFSWTFGNQSGYASIEVWPDGTIDQSSLIDCTKNKAEFLRPLGAYNDPSLYDVFKMMLKAHNITYK